MPDKGWMAGVFGRVRIVLARRFQGGLEIFRKIRLDQVLFQVLNMLQQLRMTNI